MLRMVGKKQRNVELMFIALLVDITRPTCLNLLPSQLLETPVTISLGRIQKVFSGCSSRTFFISMQKTQQIEDRAKQRHSV